MSEIKESNNLEKKDLAQTDLGKAAEKVSSSNSDLGNKLTDDDRLTDDELNKPIDDIVNEEKASFDCSSECKFITGYSYKSADFGYSG